MLPSLRIQALNGPNANSESALRKRMTRLLEYRSSEANITFLLNIAYQSIQKVTTLARVRSLILLLSTARREEIAAFHDYSEVRQVFGWRR